MSHEELPGQMLERVMHIGHLLANVEAQDSPDKQHKQPGSEPDSALAYFIEAAQLYIDSQRQSPTKTQMSEIDL